MDIKIKEVEGLYKQIIEVQKERQLTGEEFIALKELQTLTKRLNELEKEFRETVDEVMGR